MRTITAQQEAGCNIVNEGPVTFFDDYLKVERREFAKKTPVQIDAYWQRAFQIVKILTTQEKYGDGSEALN